MEPEQAPVAEHAAAGSLPSFNLLGWNLDLNDPAFWAFVGLLIFAGVVLYMKVPATVTKTLDERAARITSELAAAEALRKEAEAKLAEVQKRAAQAEADAKQIVEFARREADQLAAAASAALTERIALREKLAEERIARAEADAVRDVKLAAVETASRAASAIMAEQLTGKAADDEFARSLAAAAKALS
jgi:F-type H+-transporting ATPase subunit b